MSERGLWLPDLVRVGDAADRLRDWQRREWSITHLPSELGARVGRRDFGTAVLGVAAQRGARAAICLSTALDDADALKRQVLAHECGHLLLGDRGPHFCGAGPRIADEEWLAWYVASYALVPSDLALRWWRREIGTGEVTGITETARSLIIVRLGLAGLLGEIALDPAMARRVLGIGRALFKIDFKLAVRSLHSARRHDAP